MWRPCSFLRKAITFHDMAQVSTYRRIATIADPAGFRDYLSELGLDLPVDDEILAAPDSPLAAPINAGQLTIGNRFAIHPMEGWDGSADGNPSEHTTRRWKHFGKSGAKLIWGGEAVAVRHDGRANPNQLLINDNTKQGLADIRQTLIDAHIEQIGSDEGLVIGLQLTHSGRFARPNRKDALEPRIAYSHPLLDEKFNVNVDEAMLSDDDLYDLIQDFIRAAIIARELGYDFVDIKHCHGYLGHELLSAHTRKGDFGGSFENRTRFLREITQGIRKEAPGLEIGVRFSAFDMPPFHPDGTTSDGKLGPGTPDDYETTLPYRYGFGLNENHPLNIDLTETFRFCELLRELDSRLLNVSAGSPYYNPHIQRPALYPPSDGYQPPEDPLVGVLRQIHAVKQLKAKFPDLVFVGTGYTYLQEFLPHVAQPIVRNQWADSIGLGRMVLSYPELPHDVLKSGMMHTKRICRTFSDCTTAPRNGLISGCYPLDAHYKKSSQMAELRVIKKGS